MTSPMFALFTRSSPFRHVIQRARYLSSRTSFSDPSRPELFYHLLTPPNPLSTQRAAFGLSFLSTPTVDTTTYLGWLPAESEGGTVGLQDFKENSTFRELLHKAIQQGLRDDVDDIQRNGAIQTHSGWMHIHDSRNLPALGRIGDPDDIIATVLVENGVIQPDTYQPMPAYRICTSDGLIQLTPGLAAKLQEVLRQRAESAS